MNAALPCADGDIGVAGHNNAPTKKFKSIYDVLIAATHKERRKFFNAGRRLLELEELCEKHWFLSPNLLKLLIEKRDGGNSCSARLAGFLQGRCVQLVLIVLLLLDVGFVFGEIFVEAYHPSCKVVRRSSVSCCPAVGVTMPSDAHGGRTLAAHADHTKVTWLEAGITQLTTLLGSTDVTAVHTLEGCAAPLVMTPANVVGCDIDGFWHALHVTFSFLSLLILLVFAVEIFLLCACLPSPATGASERLIPS